MCDFSCYGGASSAWLEAQKNLPAWPDLPLHERRIWDNEDRERIAAEDMLTLAPRLEMKDYSIPTRDKSSIEARVYRAIDAPIKEQQPIYIHLHGGGFVFGSIGSEDALCARIALCSHVAVLNLNYRHAPEYGFPTAWNDVEDALEWVHKHIDELGLDKNRVVMGGASSGALLTAAMTLGQQLGTMAAALPRIAGQVLMIPPLQLPDECFEPQLSKLKDPAVSSFVQNENAPLLTLASLRASIKLLNIEDIGPNNLLLNPGNASPSQIKGLPPTTIVAVGLDPLRDGALLYAKMLAEEGIPTNVHVFEGLPHGFRRFGHLLPTACAKWDHVLQESVSWVLSNPSPSGDFEVKVVNYGSGVRS